ncbi:MAG TPA: hypothetical protein VKR55_10345 [Bradyrhizobium sp.]|uniref:hypothetical protein n=1 Tax=Bradyrhizobium sp. TaxID=376 RepID=UPI002C26B8D6|nr:hypothetical protein [Bradyrhizobium sp.]HLZ02534.1 hypothetical protein [Bradyrhizobium sp.]
MKRHRNLLICHDRPYHQAAAGDVDARGSRRVVIPCEDGNPSNGIEVRAYQAAFRQRSGSRLSPARTAALLLTAVFFATTWTLDGQAHDDGRSGDTSARLAQTSDPPQSQAAEEQERQTTEMQARELAATKRDLEVLLRLLNRACGESTLATQAADREIAELRKALQDEHDRAEQMERDLASRRSVGPPGVSVTTTDDKVGPSIRAADAGTADLRKSLQQEHDRASRLEQDLAAARRNVDTQTALAAKAAAEANRLKTAYAGAADLQKSLQQEHDRAGRLEQDLAAARRDVKTQTALATKATIEASQLKKTADAGEADLRKSLQQEHDRASRLEQDLVEARRDVETQIALATKATTEASQLKKTADAGEADLRKSLQQEHDRAGRLEQDLVEVRRDVETQTALAAKADEQAAQLKQAAEKSSAEQRQSLKQEHDKAEALKQELSTARTKIYAYEAQALQASDQVAKLKRAAEDGTADLRESLQQERDRAAALAQELSASRHDVETQTALATRANAEASRLKQVADGDSAELKRSLQKEHDRAEVLAQNLSMVHAAIYAYEAEARMASNQAVKQAADSSAAELRKSLAQEWEREARLQQNLAEARRNVDTQTALAAKAAAEANRLKTADAGAADLRKSLQQEHDRASRLEQDLAAARQDVETQTALAAKARDEAARLWQASEGGSAELRQSLQQERERTAQLERNLVLARRQAPAPSIIAADQINAQQAVEAAKPIAAEQAAVSSTQPKAEDTAETTRLVAYARVLLSRGDIGSARIVLQRAAEMGSAQASFALAETYDPLILSKWRTYGTRGDAKRALDLYARALAGGIKEAKERSDALHR